MKNVFDGCLDYFINIAIDKQVVRDDDYKKNGILYCGNCNTPKESKCKLGDDIYKTLPCCCSCEQIKITKLEKMAALKKKQERIQKLRTRGLQDKYLLEFTFENDDNQSKDIINIAKKYVKNFRLMYKDGLGFIFWGNVDTGKTYVVGCIANALIDNGVSVLMTSLSKIINSLMGFDIEDKNAYLEQLNYYDLLILDDFGVERQTDFALEQIYTVVNERVKIGKPLIVTTNLTIDDLNNPPSQKLKRIYSRLLSICTPVLVNEVHRRDKQANKKLEMMKKILES